MERQQFLTNRLNEAARAYYQEDREIMTNKEYDTLYDELAGLEKKNGVVLSGSPAMFVGYTVVSNLAKVKHVYPALSLDKTKDRKTLPAWIGEKEAVLSWKLDGLTVVLTYEDGFLNQAVTRGNGIVGEDVTHNARFFRNIPLCIKDTRKIVVRGEAVISYEDFLLFIKCRTSLWPFGAILKDTFEKNEYFQYLNVENPDMLLEYVRQHENLPYKPIKLEDLIYISDAAGIDNRWRGVSELGNLFIDKMGLNYYRATVLVRTLLIMIKNGSSYEKLQEKVSILSFENAQIREEVQQAVRQIFENVPVFEYKGYSRAEYKRLSYQKQLKKRKNLFTIIDGGKEQKNSYSSSRFFTTSHVCEHTGKTAQKV